ncbi:MAG TPA: hypothetical protein VJ949_12870 [Cryomorphaceae bacterium]|nr:hypothetical protein [Cryomorphaceae bacterium]
MDRYDSLILEIIQEHKRETTDKSKIRLRSLETKFWKEVESHSELSLGQGKVGERITNLYLKGLIENKGGYGLTRKGRAQLETKRAHV